VKCLYEAKNLPTYKKQLTLDSGQKQIQYPIAFGETAFQKNKVLK